jgi:hypothetical protein
MTPKRFVPAAPDDHEEESCEYERVRGLLLPDILNTGKLFAVLRLQREIIAVAPLISKRGAVMFPDVSLDAVVRSIVTFPFP